MIVLYQGRRGAGKTLSMIKDCLKYHNQGWTIYSNIEMGFPHVYIDDKSILDVDAHTKMNNCVLAIDEIQILIDSRRSMSNKNMDFSHFIQQIRKRNIILLCTAQFSGTVDLRLRQHVDILAKPRFIKKYLLCEITYIDLTAIDEYDIMSKPKSFVLTYDCRPIFKLYDTNKIITIKEKRKAVT